MLKKSLGAILIFVLSAILLAGCGGYKLPKVAGGPAAADAVESNGGMAVKKGEYLYFINGTSTASADNKYGDAEKGALMRVKLGDELSDRVLIAPKVVLSSYTKGGVWIFGDRIYYTSPSQKRNKNKEILTSYLDFFSCKLDGTDTKEIMTTTSGSNAFVFFETDGVVYINYIASVTDSDGASVSKVFVRNTATGKESVVVDKYVNAPIIADNGYIYYDETILKNPDDEAEGTLPYNKILFVKNTGGEAAELKIGDTAINTDAVTGYKYMITLQHAQTFGTETALFYSKISAADTNPQPLKTAITCSHVIGSTVEKTVVQLDGGDTFTDKMYDSATSFFATFNGELRYVTNDGGYVSKTILTTSPAKKLYVEGEYLYYLRTDVSANVLCRIQFKEADNANFVPDNTPKKHVLVKDISIEMAGLSPELIGGYLYFIRADITDTEKNIYKDYLYRIKVDGTVYEKDEDGNDPTALQLVSVIAKADLPEESPTPSAN